MPKTIDFSLLSEYESEDNTTGSQELACTGGVCELVDITQEIAQMKKKTVKEGVIASYSVLVNNKGELISEVSALPEDKADIMNETFKRSEEEKQFYIQLVKELKLKFNEVEKWIQKYITSIN